MLAASISGLFRMILILIGVFVLLRFIGQILMAKNNIARQNDMKRREEELAKQKDKALRNAGKTKILRSKNDQNPNDSIIDVDYSEVEES